MKFFGVRVAQDAHRLEEPSLRFGAVVPSEERDEVGGGAASAEERATGGGRIGGGEQLGEEGEVVRGALGELDARRKEEANECARASGGEQRPQCRQQPLLLPMHV